MAGSKATFVLDVLPVTRDRWSDVEKLFGPRGACGGCWCMTWRVSAKEFETNKAFENGKGEGNRRAMRRIVKRDEIPGLIGYVEGRPIAWVSLAPRKVFTRLEKSRVLAPVDDKDVWSISCLFVTRPYRRMGVSVRMLKAAARYAATRGVRIVEGYPFIPYTEKIPDAFAWCGLHSAFEQAGFKEVCRRSKTRPVMRKTLRKPQIRKSK